MLWQTCFWLCAACVLYVYFAYPALIAVLAALRGRHIQVSSEDPDTSFSIVVAAHNEQASIARRVRELATLISTSGHQGELIVVSDGSTDDTASAAEHATIPRGTTVRILQLPNQRGKAAALNEGCAAAQHPIVVFADARQSWASDALGHLLHNFADPTVGAVGGELVLETSPGIMAGVGLYWRYEKWLRRHESLLHSTVGLSGCIGAVRRALYRPIPPGTILDDVYWPMRVAMQGFRVVHEPRARAFDRLPPRPRDEFRRKVRTLSGNFQLLTRLPAALLPWRNPVWFQFLSHKVLRLLIPWALCGLLVLSLLLSGPIYRAAFCLQIALYLLAVAGVRTPLGARSRLASAAGSFLVLNSAAWLGFWVWACGKTGKSWQKISYTPSPPST